MTKGTKTTMTQKSRKEQQAIKLISMVSDNDTDNLIYEMSRDERCHIVSVESLEK